MPDPWWGRLLRVHPAFSGIQIGETLIASDDGREVYLFDQDGRHRFTRDALTGAARYEFTYDSSGRMASVKDAYGNTTTIERSAGGAPVAIIGPYGQRTEVGLDPAGMLASVTDPTGAQTGMTYAPGGLLTSVLDARGNASSVEYDPMGRLNVDQDTAEGQYTLWRTNLPDGWIIGSHKLGQGTTSYQIERFPSGVERRVSSFPNGTQTIQSTTPDGAVTTTHSDGTVVTETTTGDPRFGMASPVLSRTTTLPSGIARVESERRVATLADPNNPLSLTQLDIFRTVNGRQSLDRFVGSTRTWTRFSAAGRQSFLKIDANGNPIEQQVNGLLVRQTGYDPRGRVSNFLHGTRSTIYDYFATSDSSNGYLRSITDAVGRTTQFARDPMGRTLSEVAPDLAATGFGWDPTGNLTAVTPPGRPTHAMSYTPVGLLEEYDPPALASLPDGKTVYEYNAVRQVTRATRPDGKVIAYTYDAAARLASIWTLGEVQTYAYHDNTPCAGCAPGRLKRLVGPGGETLEFSYDGMLPATTSWSGEVTGSLAITRDADFRMDGETVTPPAGVASTIRFGYDSDGLLTCASPSSCDPLSADAEQLSYSPQTGQLLSVQLGNTSEGFGYNLFGELASTVGRFGTTTLLAETYDTASVPRDALGRIVRKTETVQGTTHVYDYRYDLAGRLQTVTEDGVLARTYGHDGNGNRLTLTTPSGVTSGTYDEQDRLESYGDFNFTYTPAGELETKRNRTTGEVTGFLYDELGNLRHVDLPNGDAIEYVVDGLGRRVGKKKNGVLVQAWMYSDWLNPVAEFDGAGNLVARFAYGSRPNVPDLVIRGGSTYRVFSDQLGSPRVVVDVATGAVIQRMRHDEFGNVLEDTNPGFLLVGFAGGMRDPDTGLLRFGARDYDPTVGRWVSKDPIGFAASESNVYAYAHGDPVNRSDPTGLQDPGPIQRWWIGTQAGLCALLGVLCPKPVGSPDGGGSSNSGWGAGSSAGAGSSSSGSGPSSGPVDECREPDPDEPAEICTLQYQWQDECVYRCPRSGTIIKTKRHGLGPGVNPANDVCPWSVIYG